MGFSYLLASSLKSVKYKTKVYCAFSVGEKVKFRIICGTPHISSTICLTTALSLSLPLYPKYPLCNPTPLLLLFLDGVHEMHVWCVY
jgi:hypothetical protein